MLIRIGQTFEGGMAERPDSEAHGGYAFCALACLCIMGEPHVILPRYVMLYISNTCLVICLSVSKYMNPDVDISFLLDTSTSHA